MALVRHQHPTWTPFRPASRSATIGPAPATTKARTYAHALGPDNSIGNNPATVLNVSAKAILLRHRTQAGTTIMAGRVIDGLRPVYRHDMRLREICPTATCCCS